MKRLLTSILIALLSIPSVEGFSNKHIQNHANSGRKALDLRNIRRETFLLAAPFNEISTLYNQALLTNPLETKLVTGGILASLGDYIAQRGEEGDFDTKRAGAFVTFDVMYRAIQCALFPEITRVCDGHYLGSFIPAVDLSILATLEQTMANQFIIIPFMYYPLFFSLTGYVQGLSIDANIERVKTTIVPLLKRNWAFWIPIQYFQFGYVDEPLQIPFLCLVGLAWTFILSVSAGSVKNFDEPQTSDYDLNVVVQNNSTISIM